MLWKKHSKDINIKQLPLQNNMSLNAYPPEFRSNALAAEHQAEDLDTKITAKREELSHLEEAKKSILEPFQEFHSYQRLESELTERIAKLEKKKLQRDAYESAEEWKWDWDKELVLPERLPHFTEDDHYEGLSRKFYGGGRLEALCFRQIELKIIIGEQESAITPLSTIIKRREKAVMHFWERHEEKEREVGEARENDLAQNPFAESNGPRDVYWEFDPHVTLPQFYSRCGSYYLASAAEEEKDGVLSDTRKELYLSAFGDFLRGITELAEKSGEPRWYFVKKSLSFLGKCAFIHQKKEKDKLVRGYGGSNNATMKEIFGRTVEHCLDMRDDPEREALIGSFEDHIERHKEHPWFFAVGQYLFTAVRTPPDRYGDSYYLAFCVPSNLQFKMAMSNILDDSRLLQCYQLFNIKKEDS